MRIAIINGPNLNLLGKREPEIYGDRGFEEFFDELQSAHSDVQFTYFQSNIEGELIDHLQEVGFEVNGVIFNPGGYTHTSVAIADAVAAITSPVIEVHISNVYAREEYRKESKLGPHCHGRIAGMGLSGYELAVQEFIRQNGSPA